MKILVAVDENLYSMYAVNEVARLAANTWPDITLLAVEGAKGVLVEEGEIPLENIHPKIRMLRNYRSDFLGSLDSGDELYPLSPDLQVFKSAGKNLLEEVATTGRKEFRLRLRTGAPAKAILTEARESDYDLIILGCGQGGCQWGRDGEVPGKVADGADCSVLVVREAKQPHKVTCCLDHANISQESLEMINQLVTLYNVDLEIVGVLNKGEIREDVERTMAEVLDYYIQRDVQALVKVVEASMLESFVSIGGRTDLMALWLGQKSALQRIFPNHRVGKLVNNALSSVLILR